MNRQELFAKYLVLLCGMHEEPSNSRKYRTFARDGGYVKFFLGAHGAIRKGRCSSKSVSVTDYVKWSAVQEAVERAETVIATENQEVNRV